MVQEEKNIAVVGNLVQWYVAMAQFLRLTNRACHEMSDLGLTQNRILFYLAFFPEATMGSISEELVLRRSTVTAAVDVLVDKGLVNRYRAADDARVFRVELTDAGRKSFPLYLDRLKSFNSWVQKYTYPERGEELLGIVLSDAEGLGASHFNLTSLDSEAFVQRLGFDLEKHEADLVFSGLLAVEKVALVYCRMQKINKEMGFAANNGLLMAYLLSEGRKAPLRQIRLELRLESGEATVCLHRLEKKGLVKKRIDAKDRRVAHIRLTAKGLVAANELLDQIIPLFSASFPTALDAPLYKYIMLPSELKG